jgi:hypothetical protein
MIVAKLYIGLDTPAFPENRRDEMKANALTDIEKMLLDNFAGFTRYEASGEWLSPERKLYREDSLVFEIIGNAEHRSLVLRLAKRAKELLAQEAVYVTFQEVEGVLV